METKQKGTSNLKMKSKGILKEEKEKVMELAAKIDETDEMKLKMLAGLDKPDPDDAIYPAELNAHLIEQLKIMTSENNELRKCVFTKDEVIKQLNKTITDLNQRIRDIISGSGPAISSKSAGVISAKITGLCKQNRHLIAEIESYKTKNALLERKIMQLDLLNKENEKLEACLCKEEPVDINSDELKELNNKLSVVNKKLYESKNKNLELKNDILIATKILQQELGDKFTSIKDLQNDIAGWKGRAQQIILLQAKVSELEEKLNVKQKDPVQMKWKDQNQLIRELEMKKKKEADQALKDLEILKEENQELKKKLDGARCRVRNLECDATLIRQKMQTFVEKSNHDDLLINEQRNQIKNLEIYYQEVLKENTSKMNKMNSEVGEYKKLAKNTDAKIDALRQQASEKTTKIEELRAQLLRYEECSLQSVFFTPMKTATDNEIKKLSELVITLNQRLDAERHKWEELDSSHRKVKERKKRLEKRLAALEDELKVLKETFKKGSKASRTVLVRDQNMYNDPFVASSVLKKPSFTSAVEKPSFTSSETAAGEGCENLEKDELKYKLELAEEKLKITEDKLKMIEEEKQDDYNNLTEMIQTSKKLFNEALVVLRRDKCQCFS
ncbi:coiled-coil domain-containing protein 13 isoform X2 [Maniola hyperantus]|uniref:coiled-coil domain-containing protein 13 isoform X2 n=1 Tax=Aphantopus hyperantus TaxID=2795564 RepID=UPI00156A4142|nr:coiled-coil domain-containing protein 13 [Maniola hyperantus]